MQSSVRPFYTREKPFRWLASCITDETPLAETWHISTLKKIFWPQILPIWPKSSIVDCLSGLTRPIRWRDLREVWFARVKAARSALSFGVVIWVPSRVNCFIYPAKSDSSTAKRASYLPLTPKGTFSKTKELGLICPVESPLEIQHFFIRICFWLSNRSKWIISGSTSKSKMEASLFIWIGGFSGLIY